MPMGRRLLPVVLLLLAILCPSYARGSESGTALTTDVPARHVIRLTVGAGGTVQIGEGSYKEGTATVEVARLGEIVVRIKPSLGYELASVILNGRDVTSQVKDGVLTIKGLSSDGELAVSFRKSASTGWAATVAEGWLSLTGDPTNRALMRALAVCSLALLATESLLVRRRAKRQEEQAGDV